MPPDGPVRRLIRSGEVFTSDELARGEVELDLPPPAPEPPEEEQAEPWALLQEFAGKHERHGLLARLRDYRERHHHPDDEEAGSGDH